MHSDLRRTYEQWAFMGHQAGYRGTEIPEERKRDNWQSRAFREGYAIGAQRRKADLAPSNISKHGLLKRQAPAPRPLPRGPAAGKPTSLMWKFQLASSGFGDLVGLTYSPATRRAQP